MVIPGRLNDNTEKFFCHGCGWIMFVKQLDELIGFGPDNPVRRNDRLGDSVQLAGHFQMLSLQMEKSFVCQPDYSTVIVFKAVHLFYLKGSFPLICLFFQSFIGGTGQSNPVLQLKNSS
jgi:hypothetical protein